MGFWKMIGKVAANAIDKAPGAMAKLQAEGARRQGELLKEQERKLRKHERNIDTLNSEQKEKVLEARKKLEEYKKKSNINLSQSGEVLYGNKTVREWDSKWSSIGYLKSAQLTPYNKSVGLYRHKLGGQVMYIGRAIELNNGGFRKRLSDYIRASDSARKHNSGKKIHDNLDQIKTDILVVGDTEEAVKTTRLLEGQFIAKYNPEWNKQRNI